MFRENEEAFFTVMNSNDIWHHFKKHMFPDKLTCKQDEFLSAGAAINYGYDLFLEKELVVTKKCLEIAIQKKHEKGLLYCLERMKEGSPIHINHMLCNEMARCELQKIAIENNAISFVQTHFPLLFRTISCHTALELDEVLLDMDKETLDQLVMWVNEGIVPLDSLCPRKILLLNYAHLLEQIKIHPPSPSRIILFYSQFKKWPGFPQELLPTPDYYEEILKIGFHLTQEDIDYLLGQIKPTTLMYSRLIKRGFLKYAMDKNISNLGNFSVDTYRSSITAEQIKLAYDHNVFFHAAFWQGCIDAIRIDLLQTLHDCGNNIVLADYACLKGDVNVIHLFIEKGYVPSYLGYFIALHQRHNDIVRLLDAYEMVFILPSAYDPNLSIIRDRKIINKTVCFDDYYRMYVNFRSWGKYDSIKQHCIQHDRFDCITFHFCVFGLPDKITIQTCSTKMHEFLTQHTAIQFEYSCCGVTSTMNKIIYNIFKDKKVTLTMLENMLKSNNIPLFVMLYDRCEEYEILFDERPFQANIPFIIRDTKRFGCNPKLLQKLIDK